jgi:hypothetical protein
LAKINKSRTGLEATNKGSQMKGHRGRATVGALPHQWREEFLK